LFQVAFSVFDLSIKGWRLFRCARARVTPLVDLFQLSHVQVRVQGRRGDIRMVEQLLDHPKIGVVLKQMSCEGMRFDFE
jgi:hypothetical protein